MLTLPNVSLVSIESLNPERALRSLAFSKRWLSFAEVVLVTDVGFKNSKGESILGMAKHHGIKLIHLPLGERHRHEFAMLDNLQFMFDSQFCIYQEWDAVVANPNAWTDDFLLYDYIGAPWPLGSQEERWWVSKQFPVQPGKEAPAANLFNNVGNGGFSLRSKRFTEEVAKRVDRTNGHQLCSDAWMCRTLMNELTEQGIKYAPMNVAERFSCENRIYSGQFGVHGKGTIKLNGWDWNEL
jgi:hypothetical protein